MLFFTLKHYSLAVSLYTTQCELDMKSSRNIYSIEIYEKWLVQAYTCALSTSGTCSVPLVCGFPRLIPIRRRYTSLLVEPLIAFLYTALSLPLFSHVLSWISDKVALLSMSDPILFSWPILCREGQLLCEETAVNRVHECVGVCGLVSSTTVDWPARVHGWADSEEFYWKCKVSKVRVEL